MPMSESHVDVRPDVASGFAVQRNQRLVVEDVQQAVQQVRQLEGVPGHVDEPVGKAFSACKFALQPQLLNDHLREYNKYMAQLLAEHPDTVIFQSFPGIASMIAATFIGEMAEFQARFPSAASLPAPADQKPIALQAMLANETVNFAQASLFNLIFAGATYILFGLAVALSKRLSKVDGLDRRGRRVRFDRRRDHSGSNWNADNRVPDSDYRRAHGHHPVDGNDRCPADPKEPISAGNWASGTAPNPPDDRPASGSAGGRSGRRGCPTRNQAPQTAHHGLYRNGQRWWREWSRYAGGRLSQPPLTRAVRMGPDPRPSGPGWCSSTRL